LKSARPSSTLPLSYKGKVATSVIEETPEGVLLKLAPVFAAAQPNDVFGSLPSRGASKTLEEMDTGVLAEARRRHARDWEA
jgi:hypothetical protein